MIQGILFGLIVFFLMLLFENAECRYRRRARDSKKFMLDHESAKHVLDRQKYFCKCGKRKRLSQIVCEDCYREEKENMPGL